MVYVPKGSVLGSIIFLIYINELPLVLSHSCADIFADDTTLSTNNKSLDVVVSVLTNDLAHVDKWCQLNHMSKNSDKSKVYQFKTKSSTCTILSRNSISIFSN